MVAFNVSYCCNFCASAVCSPAVAILLVLLVRLYLINCISFSAANNLSLSSAFSTSVLASCTAVTSCASNPFFVAASKFKFSKFVFFLAMSVSSNFCVASCVSFNVPWPP